MVKRVMLVVLPVLALGGCINLQGPLAVGNELGTSKVGRSCITHRFASVKGDGSIDAAKRNGGITRVSTVDFELSSKWFAVSEWCTVVRGE